MEYSDERPKLPNYDPEFCGKVVKGAACVCLGLTVAELLVLLLVHPSDDRCPGWIYHAHQRSAASLWVLAGMFTVLPMLWLGNVALRWDSYYAEKTYDGIAYGPRGPFGWLRSSSGPTDRRELNMDTMLLVDFDTLMLVVLAGWCLFCAIPLVLMLGQCTALARYVNAFLS